MEYNHIIATVNDYGLEMTAKMISILKTQNSKNLVNKIDQKIIKDMDAIALEIRMPSYGYYASEGRAAGKFPPLDSIRDWMEARNIDMVALYPIARKIASLGTKANAKHFLNEFKITSEFEKDLLDAFNADVQEALKDYVEKINAE